MIRIKKTEILMIFVIVSSYCISVEEVETKTMNKIREYKKYIPKISEKSKK